MSESLGVDVATQARSGVLEQQPMMSTPGRPGRFWLAKDVLGKSRILPECAREAGRPVCAAQICRMIPLRIRGYPYLSTSISLPFRGRFA